MINSIGLPNKGLEGFLAEDLPQLAELPVPLIVSVMATSREDFARLVEGVAGARGGRRDRAQRLLPQRPLRPDRRRAAGGDRGAAGGAAPADREAADREADAERRRPGRGRGRRRGGWGRRGLADQHAEGERDRSGHRPSPGIAAGHGGLSGPAVRPIAVAQIRAVAAAIGLPIVGMGGVASGADAPELSPPGASWWRSGPRASATRGPAIGSPRSSPSSISSSRATSDLKSRSR